MAILHAGFGGVAYFGGFRYLHPQATETRVSVAITAYSRNVRLKYSDLKMNSKKNN